MIKGLKKYQIQLTPFQSTKDWTLNNIDNTDLLLFESTGSDDGEPIDLEYIDYSPDSSSNNYNCQIALEQQDADAINQRDGLNVGGQFYPATDPVNTDGTYQRSVFYQIRTSFYNTFRNPTQLFGMENVDFENGKTVRLIADKLKLFDVPRRVFGDKIVPSTVVIYDTSLDNDYIITDDGFGNLQAGTNLFSKQQEIGEFENGFFEGTSSYCYSYFSMSVAPIPPSGSAPAGVPILTASLATASIQFLGDYSGPFYNGSTIDTASLGQAWGNTNVVFHVTNVGFLDTTLTNVTMSNTNFSSSMTVTLPFTLTSSSSFDLNISKSVPDLSASATFTITHTDVSSPFVLYLVSS